MSWVHVKTYSNLWVYYSHKFQELKRFPTLQSDIAAAATEALERFREESRKTVLRLVDMESSYLTVDFFRKLHTEPDKNPNPSQAGPNADRYSDNHFRRIGMISACWYVHQHYLALHIFVLYTFTQCVYICVCIYVFLYYFH